MALDREDLLVLGWGDSGYFEYVRQGKHNSHADIDCNVIRAVSRFVHSNDIHGIPAQRPVYHPEPV